MGCCGWVFYKNFTLCSIKGKTFSAPSAQNTKSRSKIDFFFSTRYIYMLMFKFNMIWDIATAGKGLVAYCAFKFVFLFGFVVCTAQYCTPWTIHPITACNLLIFHVFTVLFALNLYNFALDYTSLFEMTFMVFLYKYSDTNSTKSK